MNHVDMRRRRLDSRLGACIGAALVTMATTAGATTIDFETPSLNGADGDFTSPLEILGVNFVGMSNGGLIRENALFPCGEVSETNQAYLGWTAWPGGCVEGCCEYWIAIGFPGPPAEPVTHLSLEARSYGGVLYLRTYDVDGAVLSTTAIQPAPTSCYLATRGVLETTTASPIAAAEVWSGQPPPPACDGCCLLGNSPVVIDNVTFDNGSVPTTASSWGNLKVLYR